MLGLLVRVGAMVGVWEAVGVTVRVGVGENVGSAVAVFVAVFVGVGVNVCVSGGATEGGASGIMGGGSPVTRRNTAHASKRSTANPKRSKSRFRRKNFMVGYETFRTTVFASTCCAVSAAAAPVAGGAGGVGALPP